MKKNFFKKLSFVLALAMIVSVLAPAAGVFAADELKLNKSERTLLLGQEGKDEYNFNIVGTKGKGWKYEWSSSDEDVATVASNGVTTAVGVGTADITVDITDKKGEDVASLTAKVTVKNNIKEITEIYMQTKDAPALDKLLANTEYDFGRKFETYGGLTTTTSKTYWTVNSDNATIDKNGVFKATEAGTYTITAYAFQSWAKCDDWKALNDPAATLNVLATKSIDVTVVPSIVEAKQVDADTVQITFDSDMSKTDIANASKMFKIVGTKEVSTGTEKIKKVTLDNSGKVATVDMYVTLAVSTEYKFAFGDLSKNFKTAEKKLANITGINFKDFDVTVGTAGDMLANVEAYDANGVVIYTGTELSSYLSFEYKGEYTKGSKAGNNVYIYADGYSAELVATFNATVYDETAKAWKTLKYTDSALATGKTTDTSIDASSLMYAAPLADDTTAKDKLTYSATGVTVAAKDSNKIVVKYVKNNAKDTTLYDDAATTFTYKTADTDKLLIGGTYMYPIAQGTATVIVYSGTTIVGAFDVTILPARSFGSAVPSGDTILTVGNSNVDASGVSQKVAVKDTLDQAIKKAGISVSAVASKVAGPTGVEPTVTALVTDNGEVTVNAKGYNGTTPAATGVYSYKITITAYGVAKDVYFTVNVLDAQGGLDKVVYYQVELGNTSVDVKNVTSSEVSVAVYGYNANNVKVYAVPTTAYAIDVKDASGNAPVNTFNNTKITVVSVSTGAVTPNVTGTYVVTVKTVGTSLKINQVAVATDTQIAAGTLTVNDSTTKEFNFDTPIVSASNILAAVKAAFSFKINGVDCEDTNGYALASLEYTTGAAAVASYTNSQAGASLVTSGNAIYVASVTFTKTDGSATFTYKIPVERSVTIQ